MEFTKEESRLIKQLCSEVDDKVKSAFEATFKAWKSL
jgi:hypothetical protein